MNAPPRRSILQSPWYWVYLFAAGALVALFLLSGKYGERQAQIENQYHARESADAIRQGETPDAEPATEDNTIVTLRPLFLILAGVFLVAWLIVWWQHFFRRRDANNDQPATTSEHPKRETTSAK